jgi:valyl-tRNA synthetase
MNKKYSLGKEFNHSQAEPLIYDKWERNGYFQPSGEGTPYYIPMPPPNITGQLHAGHALFATLQDILIRYKRQRGYDALWLPGLDHAGLATQEKIEQELQAAGLEINRENFDAMAKDWCDRHKDRIILQLKSLGASADWSRTKFTLDADMSAATTHAFITLYERGLIYYRDGGWYLKMQSLADAAIAKLDTGELKIIPETESKIYRHYLENIHDWELSRQIWWGHSIPAWQSQETGEWFIAATEQEAQTKAPGHTLIQSPDKLDTWFSSGLWSFSALGWHTNSEDYQRFFPAAMLETGKDILFFWAARQIMLSLELTGKLPFNTIYLHGLIRDSKNQKMSKSKGNGIDPLSIIDKYGADALRFGLAANTTAGQDSKLNEEHFISAAKFTRKIWNAARFILQYETPSCRDNFSITQEDLDFRRSIFDLTDEIYDMLDNYKFSLAANRLRQFFWHEFCDRYIESAKKRIEIGDNANSAIFMLHESLSKLMSLLHPFMPFITEYIYDQMMEDMIISLKLKDIGNYFSFREIMHNWQPKEGAELFQEDN